MMHSNNMKYSTLTKNMLLFLISSLGTKIISFLLVPLYTSVLSTGDYGTVDLINTMAQLLIPLLTLNVQDAVLRFALDKENKRSDVLSVSIFINIISAGGLALALFLLSVTGIIILSKWYVLFLFCSYFLGAINNSLQMYLKASDQVLVLSIGGIINALVSLGLNLVLLVVFKWGIYGYMVANCFGLLVYDLYVFISGKVFHLVRKGKLNQKLLKSMVFYSAPLILNSLAWWINNASDRYILSIFQGVAENGVYSVSYKIPALLATVTTVFYNAWSISAITEFDKRDTDGFIGNTYSAFSTITVLVCSLTMLMNIPIAHILYAKDFCAAWKYVPFLLIGTAFNAIALFEGCLFTAVKRTGDVSKTTVIGAIINTLLNIILIPEYGALGAAFATMTGYFVTFLLRWIRLRSIIKMKTDWTKHIICYISLFVQSLLALKRECVLYEIGVFIFIIIVYGEYISILRNKVLSGFKKYRLK